VLVLFVLFNAHLGNKAGFQSLGKIGKRMPGPAQLPSLRKENAGNDPTVSLVPTGGGWGAGKEDGEQQDTNTVASQPVPQQDAQQINNQQPPVDSASVKKETAIWATEMNNLGESFVYIHLVWCIVKACNIFLGILINVPH